MDFLIFGPEEPKLVFEQDPQRGAVIRCDNRYMLRYSPEEPITWTQVARSPGLGRTAGQTAESEWHSIIERLKGLRQTDAEKVFLTKIAEAQEIWEFNVYQMETELPLKLEEWEAKDREQLFKILLETPAVIPQVWVNFIHYDPHDRKRAEKSHLMPFRVNFLRQGKTPEDATFKNIIVEIDDLWHIADIEKNVDEFLKSPEVKPSLEKFTEHLRKDRWLRRQGWEVCRFSTLEVEKEDCTYLFFEMQNLHRLGGEASYFPYKD